jgi:hypothetical protein
MPLLTLLTSVWHAGLQRHARRSGRPLAASPEDAAAARPPVLPSRFRCSTGPLKLVSLAREPRQVLVAYEGMSRLTGRSRRLLTASSADAVASRPAAFPRSLSQGYCRLRSALRP